ncbi:MAG TPA: AI-2E family transporter [Patescibacteria group bacterium]|nr:AI-2E family transporter [Patescibacteria group bacterium]
MLHNFIKYLLRNQVLLALFLIALFWFIVQIRGIILSIFLSYIIMAAVLPAVTFFQRKKFPKIIAVLIPYLGLLTAVFLLVLPLIPFFTEQIQALFTNFPKFLDRTATNLGLSIDSSEFEQYLTSESGSIGQSAVNVTTQVFGGIFSVITIFVVSFYLLMYHENFKNFLANQFHDGSRTFILHVVDRINEKLGAWLRGEFVLMLFIGTLSWIGLTILGLPYALPLALLAGLLEIIPTLGPIISAIPAVIVAFTISPTMAITVVVLYMLIQALENQLLVPKVMQKAVGLNPVVVILSIMIGAKLMGIAGALLAIPFISFIIVLFNSLEER